MRRLGLRLMKRMHDGTNSTITKINVKDLHSEASGMTTDNVSSSGAMLEQNTTG